MFKMVAYSLRVDLCGNKVDIEAGWCGRGIRISGQLVQGQGDIPSTPCSLIVTPSGVTIEDDSGGELVIQLSDVRISEVGGEE